MWCIGLVIIINIIVNYQIIQKNIVKQIDTQANSHACLLLHLVVKKL